MGPINNMMFSIYSLLSFLPWRNSPSGSRPHCRGFTITLRQDTTLGRTLLDEWQPDAETSAWQHTTLTTDKPSCIRRDSNPHPSKRTAADPRRTSRGHWDRQNQLYRHEIYSSHVINSQTCCGTPHLPYNGSFESTVITTTKTPWWWHVWCAETCRRIVNVGRIYLVHVQAVLRI